MKSVIPSYPRKPAGRVGRSFGRRGSLRMTIRAARICSGLRPISSAIICVYLWTNVFLPAWLALSQVESEPSEQPVPASQQSGGSFWALLVLLIAAAATLVALQSGRTRPDASGAYV